MILVVGATGNVGRHVVAELVKRDVPIRAVTRDVQRAASVLPSHVELVRGDLTNEADAARALAGIQAVYLATNGADQVVAEQQVIDAARAVGVDRLVKVSVIGASPTHYVWYAQAHAAIEEHLAKSAVPATIIRPNWFMENFLGSAGTIAQQGAMYGSAGEGRVAFIDSRDTAAVAVRALLEPGHLGKEYHLTGGEALTFAEAAERIGAGIGRAVTYVDLPDAHFREGLVGAGLSSEVADIVVQINRNAREGNLAQITSTVDNMLGTPPRKLEGFAREHMQVFTPAESS